jgi:hypothetical protein
MSSRAASVDTSICNIHRQPHILRLKYRCRPAIYATTPTIRFKLRPNEIIEMRIRCGEAEGRPSLPRLVVPSLHFSTSERFYYYFLCLKRDLAPHVWLAYGIVLRRYGTTLQTILNATLLLEEFAFRPDCRETMTSRVDAPDPYYSLRYLSRRELSSQYSH